MKQILLCAVMVLLSSANVGAQNRGAALRPDLPLPENLDVRHNPVEQKARKSNPKSRGRRVQSVHR